jgi:hypothetical protein
MPKSCKILRNQTISHVASHAEMYSASAVEVAIVAFSYNSKILLLNPCSLNNLMLMRDHQYSLQNQHLKIHQVQNF